MAIMKISELSKTELIQLIDNRRAIIQEFIHENFTLQKIKDAIDEVKSILDEIDDRITV